MTVASLLAGAALCRYSGMNLVVILFLGQS
jgi:hypothetical protein